MPIPRFYPEPRSGILRWIAEVGADLPEDVRQRLRSGFFTSTSPLIVGSLNTILVALVVYVRSGHAAFACIAFADAVLLATRLHALRRVPAWSDALFAGGLLWAALQGVTIALVIGSGDTSIIIVVLASSLAAIGGIIGRNFTAPRYAIAQTLVIDLSFKLSFVWREPGFTPLLLLQTIGFVLFNLSLIRQQRNAAIRAVTNEMEGRAQSVTDPLTGLLNRRGLDAAFVRRAARAEETVLYYLDLDGFKQVNDRLGHAAGDAVLQQVGERLRTLSDRSAATNSSSWPRSRPIAT